MIRRATRIAEEIMDAGKSDRYDVAVTWLGHAKAAYLAGGRKAEWKRYFFGIHSKHERKRELMGLVKGL